MEAGGKNGIIVINDDMKVENKASSGGLARQGSITKSKNYCLCSPTTHTGSFRCRMHRAPSGDFGGGGGGGLHPKAEDASGHGHKGTVL
ncbi:hypothetical protein LIER_43419 [Lithospermum erythrorhizon]|uniref:Uncharacterized protein n=1 Tax=Lithospermum erythrorhizon TaxID=34254 RepID=A0AAV3Q144_LITER